MYNNLQQKLKSKAIMLPKHLESIYTLVITIRLSLVHPKSLNKSMMISATQQEST